MQFTDPAAIHEYWHNYIGLVPQQTLREALITNTDELHAFLQEIEDKDWSFAYAEGKWSITGVIQHLIDTERIFQYRALSFARGEEQSLPGFDHNAYVDRAPTAERTAAAMAEEYRIVRTSTNALYMSMGEKEAAMLGTANGNRISVEAIGFVLCGHFLHHRNVLQERYLKQ